MLSGRVKGEVPHWFPRLSTCLLSSPAPGAHLSSGDQVGTDLEAGPDSDLPEGAVLMAQTLPRLMPWPRSSVWHEPS